MELSEILHPVKEDIEKTKSVFYELLESQVRVINIIAKFFVKQRGKWLRPALVLLSARLCGKAAPESYKAAALIEMLHNATLIHDDVVDDARIRRGVPSLNAVWKTKIPILLGDYILAKSLAAASQLNSLKAIDVLSNTSARMSQGEISQLIKNRKSFLEEEDYFQIISDKTAALISACCQLGGVTSKADDTQLKALDNYGENLGLAFQIKDDLLDFQGDEKLFGKKKGTDIKNGKMTLPLIYAISNTEKRERNKVIKRVKKNTSDKDVKYVIDFVENNGGIEYAEQKAVDLINKAKKELDIFPESIYKNSMIELTQFVINRNR